MRLSPDLYQQHFNQAMQGLLEGDPEVDSTYGNCPVKLSDFARVNKLLSVVPDLPRVLLHLGIDPEDWRDAESSWNGAPLGDPDTAARYSLLYSRIDVSEDAAAIAASPAPTTRGLLERGGAVVALGPRQVLITGYVLRDGKAFLRTCDLLGRKVLWESASALHPWTEPPPRRSFRVLDTRVILVHERRLISIQLRDGQGAWSVELPGSETIRHEEELRLFHVPRGDAPGVVAIAVAGPAGSHTLLAFDEDSGALLWQRVIPAHSTTIRAIAGVGLMVHTGREQGWVVVHDARSGSVLASFGAHDGQGSGYVENVDVIGATLVLYVRQTANAPSEPFTILLVDPRDGRLLEMVRHSTAAYSDKLLDVAHRPLWLSWGNNGRGLRWLEPYPDPRGRLPEERWERWLSLGKTLEAPYRPAHAFVTDEALVIVYNEVTHAPEGGRSRGVFLSLDRRTLVTTREIRLEHGVTLPDGKRETLAVRGNLLAFMSEGFSVLDLRSGQRLWTMPVPRWRSLRFLGVWLLVSTYTGWLVIEPESGTVVASWPPDG